MTTPTKTRQLFFLSTQDEKAANLRQARKPSKTPRKPAGRWFFFFFQWRSSGRLGSSGPYCQGTESNWVIENIGGKHVIPKR